VVTTEPHFQINTKEQWCSERGRAMLPNPIDGNGIEENDIKRAAKIF